MSKHFDKLKVEKLPESEATVTGAITVDFLKECRAEALKELGKRLTIPGFRQGHVPEDVLVKQVGEMHVLEETAEVALAREYGNILKESNLSPITRPEISITKLAPGIPLEFKIKVALEPEFVLPDYKKIAKEADRKVDAEVTDKDIDAVEEEIKTRKWTPDLKEGENLRDKIKENLMKEKEFRGKGRVRLNIVDALVKAIDVSVPNALAESELTKMLAQFKDDVVRAGATWEEYLKSIGKDEAAIRTEWKPKAIERVKGELVIAKIAEAEKIDPKPEDLEHEVKHLLEHYPDADPLQARIYLYGQMRNERVFEFLEAQQ